MWTNFSKFSSTKFNENPFCSSVQKNLRVLDEPRRSSSPLCSAQSCRMWPALYTPRFDSDLSISSDIPNARDAAFYKTAHAQTRHTAVHLDHQVLTPGRSVGSRAIPDQSPISPRSQSVLWSFTVRPFLCTAEHAPCTVTPVSAQQLLA
jgi:hypothetical protein